MLLGLVLMQSIFLMSFSPPATQATAVMCTMVLDEFIATKFHMEKGQKRFLASECNKLSKRKTLICQNISKQIVT